MSNEIIYRYCWRNNPKRAALCGRACRILARGTMNTRLIEFEDGRRELVSGNALKRKGKNER